MNLADLVLRHADSHPDRCALSYAGREITYSQYRDIAGRLAGALLQRGVEQGDRVLFYSRNNPEYFITYTACAWIGAVFTPVHHTFQTSELGYVAENSGSRVVIVSSELVGAYADFSRALPALPRDVIVIGDELPGSELPGGSPELFDALVGAQVAVPDIAPVAPDTPVLICYTSGSTSRPKPVLRSHAGEIWNAETYRHCWDLQREDRALMALPLSWVYGLSTLGQALLAAGTTIEVLSHFNPVTVLQAIESSRITLFGGTNTMYVKMLDVHDRRGGDLSSLRNCYIGGEPSNPAAVRRFESIIGSRLWQGYAATEAAPVLVTDPRRDAEAPEHTVGRLVPGAELELVDDQGNPVRPGEPGEALLRCPGSMLGYFREDELTASRMTEDGWFRSGDLLAEHDGYYFVVGRKSDMIIRGGSNIAPAEVESALTSIPGVRDAVVVGVPDPEYGERVAAILTTGGGEDLSDEALTHALSARLASYKVPSVYLRDLALPDGTTGKRDRRAIRDLAVAALSDPLAPIA
jgi:long-chain acyl-CoA synthetase